MADDFSSAAIRVNVIRTQGIKEEDMSVCGICDKKFYYKSEYEKHVKQYSIKHKYYECCNKVEDFDCIHKCARMPLDLLSAKKNEIKCKKYVAAAGKKLLSKSINKIHKNDKTDGNLDRSGYNRDDDDDNDVDKKDLDPDASTNELDQEDYTFDESNKKKKKTMKKSSHKAQYADKIYKCQLCLELFTKYLSLSSHLRLIHEKKGKYKCPTCDEDYDTMEDYEFHMVLHGPEDKVICKGCKKTFSTLKLYYIHAKQNPGMHCFICKLCFRKFPTELMLDQHVCICQNGKPLLCACGREFTKYKDVIDHSKGTKPFNCCSCPHLASSLTAYLRHLRKHSKQKPYQCNKCDMKFAVIDFLNIHNKKFHNNNETELSEQTSQNQMEEFRCSLCDEKFKTTEELQAHINKMHEPKIEAEEERVQCPDCGKLLKKNRLENHRNTHKISASLCPECGKLFDTRFKLTQHIITAHNNEPVKCEVCSKMLKTKKILNEHMKTHLKSELGGRIPQAICPMCGLGLAQKGSLARHILLTHEKHKIVPCNKAYSCQECSAVLQNRSKYYSHRRMHRAMVDRFPCEVCGREFNKKQNLKRHMYLLHDQSRVLADPIFKCQFCTRCFREKKNLKRHYKMVHKVEDVV